MTTKLLEPVVTFYHSNRQFVLYRRAKDEGSVVEEGRMPCAPLCRIKFGVKRLNERWHGTGEHQRQGAYQRQLRPKDCRFTLKDAVTMKAESSSAAGVELTPAGA